uniref:Uncharacterized protein n=1 Tax=Rhodopseudomonas palustris (strain BisA53) TaxID=316055 RepID=Q07LT0_RHOP5
MPRPFGLSYAAMDDRKSGARLGSRMPTPDDDRLVTLSIDHQPGRMTRSCCTARGGRSAKKKSSPPSASGRLISWLRFGQSPGSHRQFLRAFRLAGADVFPNACEALGRWRCNEIALPDDLASEPPRGLEIDAAGRAGNINNGGRLRQTGDNARADEPRRTGGNQQVELGSDRRQIFEPMRHRACGPNKGVLIDRLGRRVHVCAERNEPPDQVGRRCAVADHASLNPSFGFARWSRLDRLHRAHQQVRPRAAVTYTELSSAEFAAGIARSPRHHRSAQLTTKRAIQNDPADDRFQTSPKPELKAPPHLPPFSLLQPDRSLRRGVDRPIPGTPAQFVPSGLRFATTVRDIGRARFVTICVACLKGNHGHIARSIRLSRTVPTQRRHSTRMTRISLAPPDTIAIPPATEARPVGRASVRGSAQRRADLFCGGHHIDQRRLDFLPFPGLQPAIRIDPKLIIREP